MEASRFVAQHVKNKDKFESVSTNKKRLEKELELEAFVHVSIKLKQLTLESLINYALFTFRVGKYKQRATEETLVWITVY